MRWKKGAAESDMPLECRTRVQKCMLKIFIWKWFAVGKSKTVLYVLRNPFHLRIVVTLTEHEQKMMKKYSNIISLCCLSGVISFFFFCSVHSVSSFFRYDFHENGNAMMHRYQINEWKKFLFFFFFRFGKSHRDSLWNGISIAKNATDATVILYWIYLKCLCPLDNLKRGNMTRKRANKSLKMVKMWRMCNMNQRRRRKWREGKQQQQQQEKYPNR